MRDRRSLKASYRRRSAAAAARAAARVEPAGSSGAAFTALAEASDPLGLDELALVPRRPRERRPGRLGELDDGW